MYEKLGRFEIKGILGRGAMGEVFLGIDPGIGREVAIKTILPSANQPEEARSRFQREAKAAGVLNHPNIVTIYEFGEDQGVLYIAMERVKGQDLEELIRTQGLTHGEILEVLAQVNDGLEFAHRNGVIHRDIKPSNVMVLRDGRRLHVKVMDFGVARMGSSDMTATGTVVGTVSYMAPEYIRTGKPDARSDLFAVGVMLYECISGRKPFGGETAPTILYRIVNEPPDPIDLSQVDGISPAIRSVLDQSLAKNPSERFPSAEDFARALRAAKDPTWQGPILDATVRVSSAKAPAAPTQAAPIPPKPTKTRQFHPGLLAALGGAAGILVMGGAFAAYRMKALQKLPPAAQATPKVSPAAPSEPTPAPVVPTLQRVEAPTPTLAPRPQETPGNRLPSTPEPFTKVPTPTPNLASMAAPQRQSTSNISLSEAINLADSDPKRALEGFRAAIAANPSNVNAYAWMVAILYEQGRYNEIPVVFAKARENGIGRARMMANIRFRMAMQNDRLNRRIPGSAGNSGDE